MSLAAALVTLGPAALGSQPSSSSLNSHPYPRIGMLWSPYQGQGELWRKAARYSLVLVGPDGLGLKWAPASARDLSEKLVPETVTGARSTLKFFSRMNPASQVIVETYFYEADKDAYPDDSPWWMRDEKGNKVEFWKGCWNMATDNEEYITHVANRILAIGDATEGRAGTYLDNIRFDAKAKKGWLSLIGKVRKKRPNHFIMANAGWDSDNLEWLAPHINGIMYEDSVHHTKDKNEEKFYARVAKYDKTLRKPTRSVVEIFGKRGDEKMAYRELCRTLVYTDAGYLFADSTYGHRHNWRNEWDPRLGKAKESHKTPNGKFQMRSFEKGVAAWNPSKKTISVRVERSLSDLATGDKVTVISLRPGEGFVGAFQ